MASQLLTTLKKKIQRLDLVPSGGGCFELSVDGNAVYSKLETGQFPDEGEMVAKVSKLAS